MTITNLTRFNHAIARFDAANAEDPNQEVYNGKEYPKELLYAQRMTEWLNKLNPNASEALQLATRCQHIRRWTISRSHYPKGVRGYKEWRTTLAKYHAEYAGSILKEAGYDEETIQRVQSFLRKERLKLDPEVQLLEDVICLVFLESYFADFAKKHDEETLIRIIRKTWKKMSPKGHQAALGLSLSEKMRKIVEQAVGT